ncbi:MAG TPA: HlyC/CorC family transporter [Clostridiales bacterium]|nr:HlyC/CorC family transporter [Clostridiales bacterium]
MLTQIIVIIVLIMLNAYFAGSEMALVSLNDTKIRIMAEEGNKKAVMVRNLLNEPSKFLSTIQVGITLAGFLSSAFASEAFADRLVEWLFSIGISMPAGVLKPAAVVLITLVLSYFTLVFGELVPKRLAMQNAEKLSLKVVGPLRVLAAVTSPIVKLLTVSTNFFVKVAGGNPNAETEEVTEEEIRMMIDVGEEKGSIDEIEKEFINNVFDFDDKVVADIMTHRTRVAAIPVDASLDEILELINSEKYTRIPVYDDTIDNIVGILHAKDILQFLTNKNETAFDIHKLMRKPYFVPESKKLDDLFRELQVKKIHMVVVVDEYGGTAGIITVEDLLEEIVGNIFDEYDEEEQKYEKLDDSTYIFDGSISLEQVAEIIGVTLPVEDYDTLSGYIIGQLGQIPDEGEKPVVEMDNLVFKVEEIDEKMISKIKVCKA